MVASNVYGNARQFEHLRELNACVLEDWDKVSSQHLRILIASMPHRLFEVTKDLEKKLTICLLCGQNECNKEGICAIFLTPLNVADS